MDTITLEGKEFVSTKRAAEITGYAKDYIGQLCREGRVESRLIGRNWYIQESSIREHRFGASGVSAASTYDEEDAEEVEESVYEQEDPVAPEENEALYEPEERVADDKAPDEVPSPRFVEEEEPKDDSQAIEEIQQAWKNWFSNRYVTESVDAPQAPQATFEEKEEPVATVRLEKVPEKAEESRKDATEDAAPIRISRIGASQASEVPTRDTNLPSMRRTHRFIGTQEASKMPEASIVYEKTISPTPKKSHAVLKASMVAIAGLSLAVAAIGAGALDTLPATNIIQTYALRYIGGVISF